MITKVKKILGLFLALVLVVTSGLGSSKSYAAEETKGSITLNGTTSNKYYSAYKIFDLKYTESQGKKKVAYTIASDWKDFFTTGNGQSYISETNESGKLNPIVVGNATKYINITEANVANFAKAAMVELNKDGIKRATARQQASGNSLTFSNLDLGYYLIHPEGATEALSQGGGEPTSVVTITSTLPNAEVKVKATYPTIDKKVDKKTADIGEELTYTLTSKVPDTTGYKTYTYKLTDSLSKGLSFVSTKDDVEVKIGNQAITDNVTKTIEGQDLTVSFNMLNLQNYLGQPITVTYKAKLNKDAVITTDGNSNDVTLVYSNNPRDSQETEETKDSEKVYTAKIIVKKTDDSNNPLAGAKFKLKNFEGKYYSVNAETKAVTWTSDEASATEYTTAIGEDGSATVTFEGLAAGTYNLEETEAPAGYNRLTEDTEVIVRESKDNEGVVIGITDGEATVVNKTGVELPGTGGMGTTVFSIIGGAIIIFAAYSLVKGKLGKERE